MLDSDDLLDIQTRLRADGDGAERRRVRDALDELRRQLKRRMDAGVAPAEFRAIEALSDAAGAAGDVVDAAWRRYHPGADI